MKLLLIFAALYLYGIQIVNSKKFRLSVDDEIHPYTIDKSVPTLTEYFSLEHTIFELIDDDTVRVGGYVLCIKGMDPKLPVQLDMRSQYREQSIWYEGPLRLFLPNSCPEGVNPSRPWYNITKLWKCPMLKGDKMLIESQIINVQIVLPPSIPIGPWKAYFIFSQGLLGGATKFGAMGVVELIEVV